MTGRMKLCHTPANLLPQPSVPCHRTPSTTTPSTHQVFQLSHQDSRWRLQRNPDRPARTPSSSWPMPPDHQCFYHRNFGKDAHRCKGPCIWCVGTEPRMSLASIHGADSCILLATDSSSNTTYLVDSSAEVSTLPCPRTSEHHLQQHPPFPRSLPTAPRFPHVVPLSTQS